MLLVLRSTIEIYDEIISSLAFRIMKKNIVDTMVQSPLMTCLVSSIWNSCFWPRVKGVPVLGRSAACPSSPSVPLPKVKSLERRRSAVGEFCGFSISYIIWLVVSNPLKNISQLISVIFCIIYVYLYIRAFPLDLHPISKITSHDNHWLVVYLPLWKIWVCQMGWWHSQYIEK